MILSLIINLLKLLTHLLYGKKKQYNNLGKIDYSTILTASFVSNFLSTCFTFSTASQVIAASDTPIRIAEFSPIFSIILDPIFIAKLSQKSLFVDMFLLSFSTLIVYFSEI